MSKVSTSLFTNYQSLSRTIRRDVFGSSKMAPLEAKAFANEIASNMTSALDGPRTAVENSDWDADWRWASDKKDELIAAREAAFKDAWTAFDNAASGDGRHLFTPSEGGFDSSFIEALKQNDDIDVRSLGVALYDLVIRRNQDYSDYTKSEKGFMQKLADFDVLEYVDWGEFKNLSVNCLKSQNNSISTTKPWCEMAINTRVDKQIREASAKELLSGLLGYRGYSEKHAVYTNDEHPGYLRWNDDFPTKYVTFRDLAQGVLEERMINMLGTDDVEGQIDILLKESNDNPEVQAKLRQIKTDVQEIQSNWNDAKSGNWGDVDFNADHNNWRALSENDRALSKHRGALLDLDAHMVSLERQRWMLRSTCTDTSSDVACVEEADLERTVFLRGQPAYRRNIGNGEILKEGSIKELATIRGNHPTLQTVDDDGVSYHLADRVLHERILDIKKEHKWKRIESEEMATLDEARQYLSDNLSEDDPVKARIEKDLDSTIKADIKNNNSDELADIRAKHPNVSATINNRVKYLIKQTQNKEELEAIREKHDVEEITEAVDKELAQRFPEPEKEVEIEISPVLEEQGEIVEEAKVSDVEESCVFDVSEGALEDIINVNVSKGKTIANKMVSVTDNHAVELMKILVGDSDTNMTYMNDACRAPTLERFDEVSNGATLEAVFDALQAANDSDEVSYWTSFETEFEKDFDSLMALFEVDYTYDSVAALEGNEFNKVWSKIIEEKCQEACDPDVDTGASGGGCC